MILSSQKDSSRSYSLGRLVSHKTSSRVVGLAAGISLANLYMLSVWDELQDHWFDYFRDVPFQTWSVLRGAIFYLILLGLLFWLLTIAVERTAQPVLRRLGCCVLLAALLLGLDIARVQGLHFYGDSLVRLLGKPGLLLAGGFLAIILAYYVLIRDRALMKAMRLVLLFLLPLVPINLASVAWAIHSTWPEEKYRADRPLPLLTPHNSGPRFVWIIFDEWDYDLTFPDRAFGLSLPEIDRFRNQSLHADTVFSPAHDTQESLPSLITGRIVAKTQRTAPDDLLLTYAGTAQAVPWSVQPNIFQRVRQLGVNAALAGFFHPYPRILGGDLVESSSVSSLTLFEESDYWNELHGLEKWCRMLQSPLYRVPLIAHSGVLGDWRNRQTFKVAYLKVRARSLDIVKRPEIGLAFLHLPVPHPPAIYDRKRGEITVSHTNDYADNLALADLTLGELRKEMETAHQWDDAFVLLTSDHPLRGKGTKHPWIPFLLKTPGQKESLAYDRPFNSVLTQELVLAAIGGKLHSPEDVARWLDTARLRYPTTGA